MDYVKNNNFKGLTLFNKIAGDKTPTWFDGTLPSKEEIDQLPNSLFADTVNREYPINTPQNTYLSAMYMYSDGAFNKTASESVKDQIILAGEMHGIGEELDELSKMMGKELIKMANASKSEASSIKYAYINDNTGYFPISNNVQIADSAKELANNFNKLPLPIFKVASENIVEAYNNLDEEQRKTCNIAQIVKDYGNIYVKDSFKLASAIKQRWDRTHNDFYKELGELVLTDAKDDTLEMEKIASTIYELDVQEGLDKEYGKTLIDPFTAGNTTITLDQAEKYASEYVTLFDQLIPFKVFAKEPVKEAIKVACTKPNAEKLLSILSAENPDCNAFGDVVDRLPYPEAANLYRITYKLG